MTRDWPKEPWGAWQGGIKHGFSVLLLASDGRAMMQDTGHVTEFEPGIVAARSAECVNAMKGYSAPEGAVAELIQMAALALTVLGFNRSDRNGNPKPIYRDRIKTLAAALEKFERVEEPS